MEINKMELAHNLMDANDENEKNLALKKFKDALTDLEGKAELEGAELVRDLLNKSQANPEKARQVAKEIDRQIQKIRNQRK